MHAIFAHLYLFYIKNDSSVERGYVHDLFRLYICDVSLFLILDIFTQYACMLFLFDVLARSFLMFLVLHMPNSFDLQVKWIHHSWTLALRSRCRHIDVFRLKNAQEEIFSFQSFHVISIQLSITISQIVMELFFFHLDLNTNISL